MYLLKEDVDSFASYLEEFSEWERDENEYWYYPDDGPSVEYFFARPHLLLPLGFDEARHLVDEGRAGVLQDEYERTWLRRAVKEAALVESKYAIGKIPFDFAVETIFRSASQGAWYWFFGLENGELIFRGPGGIKTSYQAVDLIKKLRGLTEHPDLVPRTLWLPRIWTPQFQDADRQRVSEDVTSLLNSLQTEGCSLRSIKPAVLEELIAELLRGRGMDVYVTKKTRDGGRDIIARCDTVMGDPLTFAIEVKQKEVVGIEDVRSALRANEHFPALMLVTAGRFSSGVIEEKGREGNSLRLMLKDGVAISQWIASYSPSRDKNGEPFTRTQALSSFLR